MRKLTFTNSANGLTAEVSSESPTMHLDLANFDGAGAAASAITYKPVRTDGQKTISTELSARSITVPVQFTAVEGGSYSRRGALAVWDKLLRVFCPLDEGWLVWTDGVNSRRIKCRPVETPRLNQVLPYLFSAAFSLTADFPYWEDCTEKRVEVAAGAQTVTVTNACGLTVPLCIDVPAGGSQPLILNRTSGKAVVFDITPGQDCTVDTKECTVTLADGTLANNLLSVNSNYFWLLPGENELQVLGVGSGSNTAVIRYRDLYMGVY